MTSCPSSENLEQFLAGSLPAARNDAVAVHVRGCTACQDRLDQLSDNEELRRIANRAPRGEPEILVGVHLHRVLESLRATPVAPGTAETIVAPANRWTGLFGPPTHPGDLGQLGPYRVQEELGRGGMGLVFRAYDETLQRSVALKMLRPELNEPQARERLVREAQLAAQFRHDHVVTVYAVVNPPDGLPYLVMEYLPGPALNVLLETANRLEPRRAAGLVAQVADGLAAAHAAGLVHRDVKPSNVLLDSATGRAKLSDFGLARGAAPSGLTPEGILAGTPAYMSPEQAQGRALDARTDVYSLGVTLYEALTGEVPFRGAAHMILRQVLEEEPRPPRQYNDRLPRDLETVCIKAMAKEPDRRYPTATEFAADLRRWQRGEPVHARPAGTLERGWRWCRRNRRVAFLSAAVLTLLTLLAAGALVAALWLDQDRAEIAAKRSLAEESATAARAAQQEAATHADAAAAHFRVALGTLDTLLGEVKKLEGTPGLLPVKKQLSEKALQGLERIAQSAEMTPAADTSMVIAHEQLGDLFLTLGRTGEARKQYELMRQRAEAYGKAEPASVAARQGLAKAHDKLGDLARNGSDFATAIQHFREALQVREDLDRLHPGNARTLRELSVSHNKLGDVSLLTGDAATALESFRKALALRESVGSSEADPCEYLGDLRFTHGRLGNACTLLADYATARDHYRKALTAAEGLVAVGAPGGARQVAMCQEQLALLSGLLGDLAAGLDYLRRCLAARQALAAADPGNAEAQRDVYRTHALLGDFHHGSGDLAAARASYREGLALCERLARGDPDSVQKLNDYCVGCCKIAILEERAGDFAAAAHWIDTALTFCRPHEADGKPGAAAARYWREAVGADLKVYRAAAQLGLDDEPTLRAQEPEVRSGLLCLRARMLACRGQHREAAALAAELQRQYGQSANCLSFAARTLALCAAAVAPQPGSPSPDGQSLWRRYADGAVEVLRTYLQANPHLAYTVPTQPDFAGLRNYPPFKMLLQPPPRPRASRRETGT